MSNTCRELKTSYDGGLAERCSLNALTRIVHQRKIDWENPLLPPINTDTKWNECLAPIFVHRREQVTKYIYYQFQNFIRPYKDVEFVVENGVVDYYWVWVNDQHFIRILCQNELLNVLHGFKHEENMYKTIMGFYCSSGCFEDFVEEIRSENGNIVDFVKYLPTEFCYLGLFSFFNE